MSKLRCLILIALAAGCGGDSSTDQTTKNQPAGSQSNNHPRSNTVVDELKQLTDARQGFTTKIVKQSAGSASLDKPTSSEFSLIRYESPVGPLAAYLTKDPGDNKKHPAIIWITGGDCNSIGDVWSPQPRQNDQSASAFRKAGVVMMFPSLRGGNDNPGRREGFFGEVDDVLAAADHLAKLPYVDKEQIYLGGHSTGGTLVMLVGACSDRFKAIFSLGPVAAAGQYGGEFVYCDPNNEQEMRLRSPIFWLHCVTSPMYVLEGERDGNWDGAIFLMAQKNTNSNIKFFRVGGHDHFSVIAPVAEKLAAQVAAGRVVVTDAMISGLR